jgi:putative hemolysin
VEPYPRLASGLPEGDVREGSYAVRYARSAAELDELLRLRFAVFNLELGEGLESSFATGRDEDEFDSTCHHLVVEHLDSGKIIGTYRLQTLEMARAGCGFYTATEYDLSSLPAEIVERGVEVGRACIAREHRKRQVLYLLWKGLALYMAHNQLRFLFGCCSLTTQDPMDGHRAMAHLTQRSTVHPSLWVPALPDFDCGSPEGEVSGAGVRLPELFEIYLRYGSRIIGPPALDRRFKTIDFLVLLDVAGLSPRAHRMFFP